MGRVIEGKDITLPAKAYSLKEKKKKKNTTISSSSNIVDPLNWNDQSEDLKSITSPKLTSIQHSACI